MALRHPKHGAKIMACGGHQDIVQAMKVHHGVAGVQVRAIGVLDPYGTEATFVAEATHKYKDAKIF